VFDADEASAEAVLEHERRETEARCHADQVEDDRRQCDHPTAEHDEQQHERNQHDRDDRERCVVEQCAREVGVLCARATQLCVRRGAGQSVTQALDEVGCLGRVDCCGRRDAHHDAPVGCGFGDDARIHHAAVGECECDDGVGLVGRNDGEQWCWRAGSEVVDDGVVAIATLFALVDDTGGRHAEAHSKRWGGEQDQQTESERERPAGALHRAGSPPRPASFRGAVGVLVTTRIEHAVTHRHQHCRQQCERGSSGGHDRQDHAERHRAEHHDRHDEDRSQREHDRQCGKEHGLAGGGQRRGDAIHRVLAIGAFLAVARNDEQAVVDADSKADHHREVHRPHRQRHQVCAQVQRRETNGDAGDREDQRDSSCNRRAERDEQQDQRR